MTYPKDEVLDMLKDLKTEATSNLETAFGFTDMSREEYSRRHMEIQAFYMGIGDYIKENV